MFSKTKVENILGLGFNTINLGLYLVAMAASIMKAVVEHIDVSQILTCIYAFLLSILLIAMEIETFDLSLTYFRFFTLYRGRSVAIILLGSIIIGTSHIFILIAGILNLAFGILYILISFIPSAPSPKPIVENWQNWQDYSAEGLDLNRPRKQDNEFDNAARLKLSMIQTPQHCKVNPAV